MCKHIQLNGAFVCSSLGYDARLFFKLKKKYARVSFIAATAATILYDFLMHRQPHRGESRLSEFNRCGVRRRRC